MNKQKEKILIIKFGALGDFILCTGPFSAIRKYHPQAEITLLTTQPFKHLAKKTPWFDHIEIDLKPSAFQFSNWLKMRKFIIGNKWSRIYDLQHNDRTSIYFRFLPKPKIEWSGIATECSHPHLNPNRNNLHTIERQAEQLKIAGINQTPKTDIDWLEDDIGIFDIKNPFGLLVPGGAEHRKNKRWPKENYASLAKYLKSVNIIIDSPDLLSVDLSIRKNFEGKLVYKDSINGHLKDADMLGKKLAEIILSKVSGNELF